LTHFRLAIVASIVAGVAFTQARAQTPPPQGTSVVIIPAVGGLQTPREVRVRNAPTGFAEVVTIIDPSGNQSASALFPDANNAVTVQLSPPGSWQPGLYRVVANAVDGTSTDAMFVAGDGKPILAEQPASPSPNSAFNFLVTGFAPHQMFDLAVTVTGGLGDHIMHGTADENGMASLFFWPEQIGMPFFPAGFYRASIAALDLQTTFVVGEHPISSNVTFAAPVAGSVEVHFQDYKAGRYLWAVLASMDGAVQREYLLGPTSPGGVLDANLHLGDLAAGRYLFSTPYDWGEANFAVPQATPAETVTPTATPKPTQTPTLTPSPTPKPTPVKKKCPKKGKVKKPCKKD
jgi:hypothetical protein